MLDALAVVPLQGGFELFGLSLSLILLLAGAGLVVLEALAPGAHFIVIGVALLAAGLVGTLLGGVLGPLTPLLLAAVVLVSGAGALYAYRNLGIYGEADGGRTSDSGSLRGKTARVTERVTRDGGEVKLSEGGGFNPYFQARSVDGTIDEGEEVLVVDPGGGNVLTVESVSGLGGDDSIDRELARERARREAENGDDHDDEEEPETA
ncbi:NfeD family protein [Haloglomus halophilum]|uniref:NfeD family protein n=1 Tax=Haloglomus halophilum TaxID=2962672 RepID=UPI0020C9B946|nr:NfeD family protein [Haloglomus halophilum]